MKTAVLHHTDHRQAVIEKFVNEYLMPISTVSQRRSWIPKLLLSFRVPDGQKLSVIDQLTG